MKPATRKPARKASRKPAQSFAPPKAAKAAKTVDTPLYQLSRKQVAAFLKAAGETTHKEWVEKLDALVATQANTIAIEAGNAEATRTLQEVSWVDTDDWHACADMSCFAPMWDQEAKVAGEAMEARIRQEATQSLKLLADKVMQRAARRHNRIGRG